MLLKNAYFSSADQLLGCCTASGVTIGKPGPEVRNCPFGYKWTMLLRVYHNSAPCWWGPTRLNTAIHWCIHTYSARAPRFACLFPYMQCAVFLHCAAQGAQGSASGQVQDITQLSTKSNFTFLPPVIVKKIKVMYYRTIGKYLGTIFKQPSLVSSAYLCCLHAHKEA